MKRVSHEPGYVLHRYDWSESSVIVEVFTRAYGRMALVAKGAKRPSSNFRPVLLPLQPLMLSWGGDAEIRTLKSAEWGGGHVMPTGDALLSGYYANELLMRLLAREDPHPQLFDVYAGLVHVLSAEKGETLHAAALRAFELLLLRETGHLPTLNAQTLTFAPLVPEERYSLVPEGGLRIAHEEDSNAWLPGVSWLALAAGLDNQSPFTALLSHCSHLPGEQRVSLRHQLRALLHYHCGGGTLRTRQMMIDLQSIPT